MLWRFAKIPYVLTAHLGDVPGGVPQKTGRWFRLIYPFTHAIWRDAAQIAAVSEFTRQLALTQYPADIHPADIQVIPNGVDLEQLDPGDIKVHQPPRIVFAGRFVSQKNPVWMVQTLAKLKHLDWECILLGDGPLRGEIENQIRTAGLEDRFTLTGWITPEEVIHWFTTSDLLFMPSSSEGLPVTGVQALALGLCIVASRIGGFMEIVEDGYNGYLVNADVPDNFVLPLEQILSDTQKLLSFRLASRQKAQQFDLNKVAESYENLFECVTRKQ
jgi:glycosyltransferase involved in cell wall biosynthesis